MMPWPSIGRAVVIAIAAVGAAHLLRPLLRTASTRRRAWGLLLVPYLTPLGLVGYAYVSLPLGPLQRPAGLEALYLALLLGHLAPLAAALLALSRPVISPPASHCRQLAGTPPWTLRLSFTLRGPLAPSLAAGGLVGLLAFADFELASLLGIDSWTVRLFDAQTGGLPVGESLRLALLPAALQLLGLLGLLAALWRSRLSTVEQTGAVAPPLTGRRRLAAWSWLALAALLATAVPLGLVLRDTVDGLQLVLSRFAIGRELGASAVLAGCAAALAWLAAGALTERRRWGAAAACCLPGLLGPLLLALLMLGGVQLAPEALAHSPLPLLTCHTLLLLPAALLLRLIVGALAQPSAIHLARLAPRRPGRRALLWRLERGRHFWAVALLFGLAYFDLTAASLLRPAGMTPVTVRLYNLMHYGRSAGLSAMLAMSMALPWLLVGLAWSTRRLWARA